LNELRADILSVPDGTAGYDHSMRTILSNRQVLAWILKRFVREYANLPLEDIAEKYIEPSTILVSKLGVSKDSQTIEGISEKDSSHHEGNIYYDIVFQAYYPNKKNEKIGLYINLEAQSNYYPGYPLEMRGIYYGARRLTAQLKHINKDTNYASLQKVYSIWICVNNVPDKDSDTVTLYDIAKNDIIGSVERNEQIYDLINVVIIRLNDKTTPSDTTMKVLQTLFNNTLKNPEKFEKLEKLGLQMDDALRKGIEDMAYFSDYIFERGKNEGIQLGRSEGIRNMIMFCKQLGQTEAAAQEQIAASFHLPKDEAVRYIRAYWKPTKSE